MNFSFSDRNIFSKNEILQDSLSILTEIGFSKKVIKEKIIFNIKLIKYLKPGNDYHYFGSFRMMGNDKKISVDYNCKLNSDKSITIIDGSVLYFKNNFFPTLLIMANALRIGKKYDI